MKILITCEFSGIVRDAFIAKGHDAISCDLLPTESPGPHYQGDVFNIIHDGFDMMIAHPPCTYLCVSGNRWHAKSIERHGAAVMVWYLWEYSHIEKICLENPVGVINTFLPKMPKPQYVQPWYFGHGETKKTGLWLKNLPKLKPTNVVFGRENRIHKMPPSADRSKLRSLTYQGIADAMADQWG